MSEGRQDPHENSRQDSHGDAHGDSRQKPAGAAGEDGIGSAAEEAAKLLGAVSDWAKEHGSEAAVGFVGLAGRAASMTHRLGAELNEHLATEAPECAYCPICRTVHAIRGISPEVREHLAAATSSLVQAVTAIAATAASHHSAGQSAGQAAGQRGAAVERIDLDNLDTDWPDL